MNYTRPILDYHPFDEVFEWCWLYFLHRYEVVSCQFWWQIRICCYSAGLSFPLLPPKVPPDELSVTGNPGASLHCTAAVQHWKSLHWAVAQMHNTTLRCTAPLAYPIAPTIDICTNYNLNGSQAQISQMESYYLRELSYAMLVAV